MYAAPEQLVVNAPHTKKTDVFAFGHVLYELLAGKTVFSPLMTVTGVLKRIRAHSLPSIPDWPGPFMRSLVERCWSEHPDDRPSFDSIFREFDEIVVSPFCQMLIRM
jgi:serine/threonine protein kinase